MVLFWDGVMRRYIKSLTSAVQLSFKWKTNIIYSSITKRLIFQNELSYPEPDCEEIDHNRLWKLVQNVIKGCVAGKEGFLPQDTFKYTFKFTRLFQDINDRFK